MFKVTKSPHRLFTVKSQELKVEVYGTTFNVKSYPEDHVSEVALVEGSVGLFHNDQLMKKMVPGEAITYNISENKWSHSSFDVKQITSWKTDELIIENEPIENVIKYLERWYGVEIILDKSLQNNSKLSFKVKTESLTELLSIINHITPITYEINGKQVKLSKQTKL
jgi:ferric-dicitrate binding protein FerR (iron transport regulator)